MKIFNDFRPSYSNSILWIKGNLFYAGMPILALTKNTDSLFKSNYLYNIHSKNMILGTIALSVTDYEEITNLLKTTNMRRWHIGIDLGLNGAYCIHDNTDDSLTIEPMPVVGKHINWDRLYQALNEYEGMNGLLVFEKLGQIFQSSKATAMSMGRQSEGMIVMCKCLAIPYREIPPKEWQSFMFKGIDKIIKKGGKGIDTKAMALEKIKQLYPSLKLTFGERSTKPHDGLIDAVLLTDYAKTL